ncbi:MAG: 2TM domain-containing protein [Oculatellaceae cyanobacterium Prado106]|jgi:hypothetical protein|nr:2TM domain-containing protein [Oculatellaceae cyanobacterium Prado106]
MPEFYTSEDLQQILQKAALIQQDTVISKQQLTEIAEEIGLSPDILQQAEQAWREEQQTHTQLEKRADRQNLGFKLHLIPYIFVSTALVILNLSFTPHIDWSIYPILGWGMGVAMHGAVVYRKP